MNLLACKQGLLVTCSNGKEGFAKVEEKDKSRGGKSPGTLFCSEDLNNCRMGLRELFIDWWVKVVPAFLGGCDNPNAGMWESSFPDSRNST